MEQIKETPEVTEEENPDQLVIRGLERFIVTEIQRPPIDTEDPAW